MEGVLPVASKRLLRLKTGVGIPLVVEIAEKNISAVVSIPLIRSDHPTSAVPNSRHTYALRLDESPRPSEAYC